MAHPASTARSPGTKEFPREWANWREVLFSDNHSDADVDSALALGARYQG